MKILLLLSLAATLTQGFGFSDYKGQSFTAGMSETAKPASPGEPLFFIPAPQPLAVQTSRQIRLVTRRVRDINRRYGYSVKASYPQIAGASSASAQRFNQEIAALMTKEINNFTKDFRGPGGRDVRGQGDSTFDTQYKVEIATSDLVSVWFGINIFNSGAAHPSHESRVFNYDLGAGRRLSLGDLFKRNSNYLEVLSRYCIADLKKQYGTDSDEESIKQGAGPTAENYRNWNIKRQGLVIMFDPYQVASYAAGPRDVTVPYSVLKEILNPGGPVAALAQGAASSAGGRNRRGR